MNNESLTSSPSSSTSNRSPEPIEIAYRHRGTEWKRRTFKTEKALDKFLEKLEGAEVQFAR
jgi:hypothetical protein